MSGAIQAVILAGGRGTRLTPLTDNLPKPLVPIRGKAIIRYVLDHLKSFGITDVALSVAHLGEMIESALGDGSSLGMRITYLREPEPMGTGGWTQLVDWSILAPDVLVLNADNLFWIDVGAFIHRHQEAGAIATMAGVQIPSSTVSGAELLRPNDEKTKLLNYIDRSESAPILAAESNVFISSGWYVFSPAASSMIPSQNPISMEKDVWPAMVRSGAALGFYEGTEPWFDSGTHERLAQIDAFLASRDL